MAAESKDDYYTKTEADDEFLSSSTVIVEDQEFTGLEANKCYINDSENNKNYKLIEEVEVPAEETHSEEYSVAPGHLYKGKRYDIGATADDGTTLTSTSRKVSGYIPLLSNGTTYLPVVWEAGGANYTEICLYAAVDGHEPANDAQAVLDTKACGSHSAQTSGVVKPLTLIADESLTESPYYTFDTTNQIIRFNPSWAQYVRTYVTDDATIARAEYTETTSEILTGVNVTNGILRTETSQPTQYSTYCFLGQVFKNNGVYGIYELDDGISYNVNVSTSNASQHLQSDPTVKISKPVRLQSGPVELKYDGVIFDSTLYDTNGSGYAVIAFMDESMNVVACTEGIGGMGALTVLENEIIRTDDVTEMVVEESPASGSGGTVDKLTIYIPKSNPNYKYVMACGTAAFNGTSAQCRENVIMPYHYINEPVTPVVTYQTLSDYIDSKVPTDINNKYTWSGMYGKSICVFGGSFATTNYGAQNSFALWEDKLGVTIRDYAVGGAGYIQNVGTTPIQTQVANMITAGTKYDLYILWCSTNDKRKVGDVYVDDSYTGGTIEGNTYTGGDFDGEVIGAVDDTNRTSQSGGINWIMNQIYTFHPQAKVIMFTSMRSFTKADEYDYANTNKKATKRFVEAQIESCKYWQMPYLDQYTTWGVNTLNKTTFVRSDNLHPTEAGYARIAYQQLNLIASL